MAVKKIRMLVGDYVEDYEVVVPFQALARVIPGGRAPAYLTNDAKLARCTAIAVEVLT